MKDVLSVFNKVKPLATIHLTKYNKPVTVLGYAVLLIWTQLLYDKYERNIK